MGGWHKVYQISSWIFNIAFTNILWILFTLIGLGIFGIFPATAAMFAIVRKWLIVGERDFNILSTFWSYYRKDFMKLNGFSLFFFLIGYILYYEVTFLRLNPGSFQFLIPGLIAIGIAFIMTLLFFFPVFVHFKLKFFQYIKNAFFIAVLSPVEIVGMILAGVALWGFMIWIPGIIPLFTGSVMAICMMYLSKRSFNRIEKKQGRNDILPLR